MSKQTKTPFFFAAIIGLSVQGFSTANAQGVQGFPDNLSVSIPAFNPIPSNAKHGGSSLLPSCPQDQELPAKLVPAFEALNNGDLAQAEVAFKKQVRKDDYLCNRTFVAYGLGVTRYNKEDWRSARYHLTRYLDNSPWDYEARQYLGLAYINSGMTRLAKKHLDLLEKQQKFCGSDCPLGLTDSVNELSAAITKSS